MYLYPLPPGGPPPPPPALVLVKLPPPPRGDPAPSSPPEGVKHGPRPGPLPRPAIAMNPEPRDSSTGTPIDEERKFANSPSLLINLPASIGHPGANQHSGARRLNLYRPTNGNMAVLRLPGSGPAIPWPAPQLALPSSIAIASARPLYILGTILRHPTHHIQYSREGLHARIDLVIHAQLWCCHSTACTIGN
jgi:hypothetical protein